MASSNYPIKIKWNSEEGAQSVQPKEKLGKQQIGKQQENSKVVNCRSDNLEMVRL